MSTEIEIIENERPVIRIREGQVGIVEDRVVKANRRLVKAGIAEQFTLTVSDRKLVEERDEHGVFVVARYHTVQVELDTPRLGYGGWTFVATLVFEQGGTVVRTVPGQQCSYRPTDKACDHCGLVRTRTETFVVRNDESGEYKQLGRNCLELFFGLKPSLWALEANLGLSEDDEELFGGSSRAGVEVESVRNIVAASLAVTNGGPGYFSQAAAEFRGQATSAATADCLYERPTGRYAAERKAELAVWRTEAARYAAEATTVDAVIAAAATIQGEGDYAGNIRVLAASEYVNVKNLGYVASFVAVYNRAVQRQAEQAARATRVSEFVGQLGEKKVSTTGTVVAKRFIEGTYGTTTLIEWLTEGGLTCKWFSSAALAVAEGDKITVTGTIKKHDEYRGLKSTVFTRCSVAAA